LVALMTTMEWFSAALLQVQTRCPRDPAALRPDVRIAGARLDADAAEPLQQCPRR
jgi:hypothetical protein